MYYRVAIQRRRDHLDQPSAWQWKSPLLSLDVVFQWLRLYRALPQDQLRVFSCSSKEGLNEQLVRENQGLESTSITAAQFLQGRMIGLPEVVWEASACGVQGNERTESIAISTRARLDEINETAYALGERSMSSLERRRLELELGAGGDHDVPYSFLLPLSMPQVLAWMRLLGRVQRGELQP